MHVISFENTSLSDYIARSLVNDTSKRTLALDDKIPLVPVDYL